MTLQKTAQSITPTYRRFTQLTQKLCLQRLVITVISSDILLTTLSAPPSLQTKLADLPESMSELWLVSLMLSGWCPGREPRRTIPGRGEGCPTSRGGGGRRQKKKRACWPQQLFPHLSFPWLSEATTTPPPWYRLYWGYRLILAILNSLLNLSLCPSSPIIPNDKMILAQHPEKEA